MKKQSGMSLIMLLLLILVIIIIAVISISLLKNKLDEEKFENLKTDMLSIQGKVKVIGQEMIKSKEKDVEKAKAISVDNQNVSMLKGKKVSENMEDEEIKKLIENKIINEQDENFDKYYILEREHLDEIGLNEIIIKEGKIIVNYNTDEIIYSKGIELDKKVYYKLSEIENLNKEEITKKIEKTNEVNEQIIEDVE